MPTVLYEKGFRFWFYASDGGEPPHVHVGKGGSEAKWWLSPIREEWNAGFSRADRSRIGRIIAEHQQYLLDEWHRFFAGS